MRDKRTTNIEQQLKIELLSQWKLEAESRNYLYYILQPTFKEGAGSFVSGGPYGPEGEPPPLSKCDKTLYTGL